MARTSVTARWMVLLAIGLVLVGAGRARASEIIGPTLNSYYPNDTYAGLEFTALDNSTLQSFQFTNDGAADSIELVAANGTTVLDSVSTPSGSFTYAVSGLSWSLDSGDTYFLVNTTYGNDSASVGASYPYSDSDISITAGVLGDNVNLTTDSYSGSYFDFSDITTSGTPAPEPAGLMVIIIGVTGLGGSRWRRKSAAA